ncbi:MAG: hypothetical protein A2600_07755 [Candidatus Lambdaproteobacteria bacterium RIFOXYD1_FULL_56_27]|uniref:LamG-like jellyroll fold domain-containing protein n=1 Tax=Candidatus Lambdaproteobacteria bacterium RIFOXYD2_FULL_56_26 TaxID=1817773 RepID=A0A1F6GNF0_9PROT|nr:MAG: hypothetical protein A2557_05980 [Candidatus Lambdaproteobacteria bacterium RIFOXYD2_FULL_56_26]OGG99853.1 MAG: hypothetical protein A2426_09710 [Candidatus Lambdaproteobacteria bacterium RIFOXYC1_FULL_56_13]OGH09668.1 MAG: hypothetical protein A2600_07755 [Candidatus Lambdaproteobacteria bacterium RIFOXYD1_FULL_56_27]
MLRFAKIFFSLLLLALLAATLVPKNVHKLEWEFSNKQFPFLKEKVLFKNDLLLSLPLHNKTTELLNKKELIGQPVKCPRFEIAGDAVGLNLDPACEAGFEWLFPQPRAELSPRGETLAFGFLWSQEDANDPTASAYHQLVMVGDHDNGDRAQNVQHGIFLNTEKKYLHYGSFLVGGHFTAVPINPGEYYYVVASIDRSTKTLRFYVNGDLAGEEPYQTEQFNNAYSLFLGNTYSTGTNIKGILNQVAMWSRPLSPGEVRELSLMMLDHNNGRLGLFVFWLQATLATLLYFLHWHRAWIVLEKAGAGAVRWVCRLGQGLLELGFKGKRGLLLWLWGRELQNLKPQDLWDAGLPEEAQAALSPQDRFKKFLRSQP